MNRPKILWAVIPMTIGLGLASGMVFILSRASPLPTANVNAELKKPNHKSVRDRSKVLSLRIGALGFEPNRLSVTEGEYFLVIFNSVQAKPLRLTLVRETGEREKDIVISRESPHWKSTVRLVPGRYLVKSPDKAEWSCEITVTAN